MRKTLGFFCGIFCLIILVPDSVMAQEVDSLFFRGITAYREGRYREALQTMELLDRVYSRHARTTGSLLMQGKSLYKLKDYRRALDVFKKLVQEYPESQYQDDALYGMATVYYRVSLYKEAAQKFLDVVERGEDTRLLRMAAKHSSEIMDYRMGEKSLKELLEEVSGEKGKAAITVRLAEREIDKQHFQTAKNILQDFIRSYPNSSFLGRMEELLSRAERLGKEVLKIGVILPLTGSLSEQGKGLLEGIQYAVDSHNSGEGTTVELVIRDSESRMLRAIQAAQELCENMEIMAIIGELESDITAAIAAVAREHSVVLLAPTATLDDVTSIGPTIFQVNSSLKVRGEILAEYAVLGLGLKRFAILAPADGYGQPMRDSFVQTVNRLEGEILAEKWYFEGAQDLGPQFKAIREAGIGRMIEDSLIVILPEEEFDELKKLEELEEPEALEALEALYEEKSLKKDVLYVKQSVTELVDSTALAVTSIDGIFLPVYGDDLPYVMPQLAFYNLGARFFGGAYWNDIEVLNANQRYIDGVVFLSDFYATPSDFRYYRFRDEYRNATGETPEKMEVYGYDTAQLLLEVVGERSLPREQIRERLLEVRTFDGIRGRISFNDERVNTSLHLLQFRSGRIYQIK